MIEEDVGDVNEINFSDFVNTAISEYIKNRKRD